MGFWTWVRPPGLPKVLIVRARRGWAGGPAGAQLAMAAWVVEVRAARAEKVVGTKFG